MWESAHKVRNAPMSLATPKSVVAFTCTAAEPTSGGASLPPSTTGMPRPVGSLGAPTMPACARTGRARKVAQRSARVRKRVMGFPGWRTPSV